MSKEPEFDVAAAHRYFAADCFNRAWDFIDRSERTLAEVDAMLHAAHASAWHWRQRLDCTPNTLSVSYWQLARVHTLAGQTQAAARYAALALEFSQGESPFCRGYAYEALARAARAAGDRAAALAHLTEAQRCLEEVTDPEERALLARDLDTLQL